MAFQPSADSFGIRRLGFKCSWWHPRQANDAVASEPSIFSENHEYKGGIHNATFVHGTMLHEQNVVWGLFMEQCCMNKMLCGVCSWNNVA